MNAEMPAFNACRERSRLKALIQEKGVAVLASLQGERGGDEAGAQIKARQQRASGYVDASEYRTSEQAGYKSDERSETKMDGLRR
jgi:hypothetical protein